MSDEVDDEPIVDSWEDFDQNPEVLEEQLRKMALKKQPQILKQRSGDVLITNSDGQQMPFTMNQEPKIMILRRPDNNIPNGNASSKSKLMPKSLEQRQVEYAQARLRILGDAGAASEESGVIHQQGEEPTCLNSTMCANDPKESSCISAFNINKVGGNKPVAIVKPSQINNVNIIRKPNGPTENAGFSNRNTNRYPT